MDHRIHLSPSGGIESRLFLTSTASSSSMASSMANQVSPSGFDDEFVALSDNKRGRAGFGDLMGQRFESNYSTVAVDDAYTCLIITPQY